MPAAPTTIDPALRARYEAVVRRVQSAAQRAKRRADDVLLVAVAKSASVRQVVDLVSLGHRDFAENRVQHLIERVAEVDAALAAAGMSIAATSAAGGFGPLRGAGRVRAAGDAAGTDAARPLRWHMIGSLQRNKVRRTIELARLIHSVESMKLAEAIHEEGIRRDRVVEVLVQVNIAGEATKHGMNPRAVLAVIEQMMTMAGLEVRGLMCIAPLDASPERTRPVFERCAELFGEIRRVGVAGPRFDLLSMGMSNDFEVAIECGANLVRVGTAIFGAPAE